MNKVVCPSCDNIFCTTSEGEEVSCPFCHTYLGAYESNRRFSARTLTEGFCDITMDGESIPVKRVDISGTGIGIKTLGDLPFGKDAMVSVLVDDFKIEKDARVVWTTTLYGMSRAGLMYC